MGRLTQNAHYHHSLMQRRKMGHGMPFGSGQTRFCWVEQCRNRGSGGVCSETHLMKSRMSAELAVTDLTRDPATLSMLRDMAFRAGIGSASRSNGALMKWVASQLASGRLRMCQAPVSQITAPAADPGTTSGANTQTERPFPLSDRPSKTQKSSGPAPEQSSFPSDVQLAALAKTLVEAAQSGVPFCEECMQAAQRG
jgi:hypothetical protein